MRAHLGFPQPAPLLASQDVSGHQGGGGQASCLTCLATLPSSAASDEPGQRYLFPITATFSPKKTPSYVWLPGKNVVQHIKILHLGIALIKNLRVPVITTSQSVEISCGNKISHS